MRRDAGFVEMPGPPASSDRVECWEARAGTSTVRNRHPAKCPWWRWRRDLLFFGFVGISRTGFVKRSDVDRVWKLDLVFTPVSQVPLPAALPLFATGLGVLGLLGWRRKRKAV